MNNSELEHIIKSACAITNQESIVIIGSQSILASFDYSELPQNVTLSLEADVFFLDDTDGTLADLVDGTIGEMSFFQDTHGIFAHGVGPETAIMPSGWKDRLVELNNSNTGGFTGLCPDPHDLCISKLFAYRESDLAYVKELVDAGLISVGVLLDRMNTVTHTERSLALVDSVRKFLKGFC